MTQEKSAGVIIYNSGKYLILHYASGHWEFPKGHLKEGETNKDAAIRELEEETGITDVFFVKGFEEKINYFFRRGKNLVRKDVIFFLAETKTKKIALRSKEHQGYEWLPYTEAMQRVTYQNAKNLLIKANKTLNP